MADLGHNSGVQGERLRSFIERIERLEEEKGGLQGDIKEIYAEAKSAGYDTKVMRQVVRLRKMDAADRQEQAALLGTYMRALGDYGSTPLGGAGVTRAAEKLGDALKPGDSMSISTPGGKGVKLSRTPEGKLEVGDV